jgi:hypothetical protein
MFAVNYWRLLLRGTVGAICIEQRTNKLFLPP